EAPEEPKKGVMTKILESLGLVGGGKKEEQIPAEQVKEMLAKDCAHKQCVCHAALIGWAVYNFIAGNNVF
ncbi:MAG: hypothetical protein QXM31_03645, partial [Candidatus Woesearchaeota archaeon]